MEGMGDWGKRVGDIVCGVSQRQSSHTNTLVDKEAVEVCARDPHERPHLLLMPAPLELHIFMVMMVRAVDRNMPLVFTEYCVFLL